MDRPRLGFRKATTFYQFYAIYQRSLLHLLWVPSQLPLARNKPVLNEGRKTFLQSKKKKLISQKKGTGYEVKMSGRESLIKFAGALEKFPQSLISHSLLHSNMNDKKRRELGNCVEAVRRTMHFTYSGMERPSSGFRKTTTFHHITAIYQDPFSTYSGFNHSFLQHMITQC